MWEVLEGTTCFPPSCVTFKRVFGKLLIEQVADFLSVADRFVVEADGCIVLEMVRLGEVFDDLPEVGGTVKGSTT